MSTPAAQVRVRLSADGVKDVVNALKSVEKQAKQTASGKGLGAINQGLRELKGLLPAIGLGAAVVGFTSLVKGALQSADALGKVSAKTGATVEDISALGVAGRLADVSVEQLQGGIVRLSRSIGELKSGSQTAVQAFAQIGLAAKDFENLDTGQAFELISKRVLAIEDPFRRAQVGSELLGKGFADLIPVMQAVADQGLANLRQQAADLGLLITGDLAAAADQAGDSFDLIKLQAEGVATAFLSGLAPSIVSAMGDFSKSIKGDGVKEMQAFGRETGRILRTVIATFKLLATVAVDVFKLVGDSIGGTAAAATQLVQGNFREAGRIYLDGWRRSIAGIKGLKGDVAAGLAAITTEALRDAPPIVLPVKADTSKLQEEVAAALAKADAAAAAARNKGATDSAAAAAKREAERAAREAQKLAADQARADQAAGEARFELEQRILEATGRGSEAKLRALDAELAKTREILALAQGGVTAQDEAALGKARETGVAGINLEQVLAEGRAALEQLATVRTRIEQDVQLGIRTQFQGEQDILAIEKERLAILQAIAAQTTAAADAVGTPEAQASAAAFTEQVNQVAISVANASNSFLVLQQGASEALNGGLVDVLTNLQNFESVGDVFESLASTVASSLQRIAAEMLATYLQAQLLKFAMDAFGFFGGSTGGVGDFSSMTAINSAPLKRGGLVGYAGGGTIDATGGGRIRGPGTGTSDSIPAITTAGAPLLVSNGEFVVNAAATARHLDLLRLINAGSAALHATPRGMPRRLAAGGITGDMEPAKAGERRAGFRGELGLEPGLVMKQLDTEDFDRFLVKRMQRNSGSIRNILR
jgi:hypothetical protein